MNTIPDTADIGVAQPPPDGGLRLDKAALAAFLRVSKPTLDAMIVRHGANFPMLEKGKPGSKPYAFDPVAVRDYLAAHEAAEEAAAEKRREAIAQLGLPLSSPIEDAGTTLIKPGERLAHVKALAAEDELAIKRQFLVFTADVRKRLQAALAAWNRAEFAALRQAAARMNLPDVATRELEAALRDARTAFLTGLDALLTEGGNDGPDLLRTP